VHQLVIKNFQHYKRGFFFLSTGTGRLQHHSAWGDITNRKRLRMQDCQWPSWTNHWLYDLCWRL